MADGTHKNIEDVVIGEQVIGAYGFINTVKFLQRPKRGDRVIWDADGLLTTNEHGIMNGDRDGFVYISKDASWKEYGTTEDGIDADGNVIPLFFRGLLNTKREQLGIGTIVASEFGDRTITKIEATGIQDEYVYHLLVDGDMTYCISNTFVASLSDDALFDYTNGKPITDTDYVSWR